MSAPPVLRPLRAILQRRLQTIPSRMTQTHHYLRATHYRSQLRLNSSVPPNQPPKPEKSANKTPESDSTSNAKATEATQHANTGSTAEAVITNFDISGHNATNEAAVPRLDSLLVKSAFQQLKSTDAEIQAGIAEAVARSTVEDGVTVVAADDVVTQNQEDFDSAPQASELDLDALKHASPEKIAAMMAYLQKIQESKSAVAEINSVSHETPLQQQRVPASVAPETAKPESLSAEAVATMTEPVEPVQLEPGTPVSGPESTEDAIAQPIDTEDEFVVDPIPDPVTSDEKIDEETIVAMAEELERLEKGPEVVEAEHELPSVSVSDESAAIAESLQQVDTLESAVAAAQSVVRQEEPSSVDSIAESLRAEEQGKVEVEEGSSVHDSLETALNEELAKREQEEQAEQLRKEAEEAEEADQEKVSMGEVMEMNGRPSFHDGPEPSRIPRNVASYYLQPLRRVAEYGVPACDLQLRSYSIRPLESFCDFALRAAYYLGLPAYGPVPLPKIIERWTVPRSSFIYKKSQENYERITRRRLIQIKDANPETVQIWLAFLQKHQQAAVGMKANLWEFSSIDVAKKMDKAFRQAEPLMKDKYRLLQQNKEFETVEKVDEFLQATRYKVTGDRVERKQ